LSDISRSTGRAAAMDRRRALVAGKAGLPGSGERTRFERRETAQTAPLGPAAAAPMPAGAPAAIGEPPSAMTATSAAAPSATPVFGSGSGRQLSMMRRRQQSAGKSASAAVTPGIADAASASDLPLDPQAPPVARDTGSCREQARARRSEMARVGRGSAPPARPSRPQSEGRIDYAPKVVESATVGGQRVTGLRIGRGSQVTGDEAGSAVPVSGTGYIAGDEPGSARSGGGLKVGATRTAGGNVVTGTQVRNGVPITGDEAGTRIRVTGEAEGSLTDDLTQRGSDRVAPSAQFRRQANPHGHSVFGTNLGRSARSVGSRERERERPIETTQGGQAVTGSAVGRSARVTGDAAGACRVVTGDQYLAPAARSTECGGRGGGFAPPEHLNSGRRDPVTAGKVTEAQTWGAQRVTGPDVEHRPNVTGDEPGSCRVVTGTPYQGPSTAYAWCDKAEADAGAWRLERRAASLPVTGDLPGQDSQVTGTARGADRTITGSAYERREPEVKAATDPIAAIDARFSVASPQRHAHLAAAERGNGRAITGSFAAGRNKITGNVEFHYTPRRNDELERKRAPITGEGRTEGPAISGGAWAAHGRVTGTEGTSATARNPTERSGKSHAFAGASLFKSKGHHDEPKQIVTGMVGWSAKSAAKVTLSGGAQG
jgi:hypothetical protein